MDGAAQASLAQGTSSQDTCLKVPTLLRGACKILWEGKSAADFEKELLSAHGEEIVKEAFELDLQVGVTKVVAGRPLKEFLQPREDKLKPQCVLQHPLPASSPVLKHVVSSGRSDVLTGFLKRGGCTVIVTHADFYTPIHVDWGGTTGYIGAAEGQKHCVFWNPLKAETQSFLKEGGSVPAPHLVIDVGPGDVLTIPSGWPHAVATVKDTFGIGGSFEAEDFVVGLHSALLDQGRSEGRKGAALGKFVEREKSAVAERMGLEIDEVRRMEEAAQREMERVWKETGVGTTTAEQAKHAPRSGRGKRKRSHGGSAGRRVDKKVGKQQYCAHPEHKPTSSSRLSRRGVEGVWYGRSILMCPSCASRSKYHAEFHKNLS